MPAATPLPLRQQIWQASQQGQHPADIAQALRLPVRTVRHLLARFQADGQPSPPRFAHSGPRPRAAWATLRAQVLDLRRQHPAWGAERILAQLFPQHPVSGRPHPGTVRRWLAQAGLAPTARRRTVPPTPAPHAPQPHQVWQMDAAEKKALRSGRRICWLRLVDEASGAALFTRVYERPCWAEVGALALQASLGQAFALWGRPWGLRVDNGQPWVCPDSDLPSDLELWLAGLGVALHKNRPHVPQDNPRVERGQRTAQDWGEPQQQDTGAQLQARLDEEDRLHREVYLFDGRRSRLEAYPELRWRGRPYVPGPYWEELCWDHAQALACLGCRQWQRKVDPDGYVSLYDHRHRVGSAWRGQVVEVRFDVSRQEWVFWQGEQELGRSRAANLGAENIRGLRVRRRPGRSAQHTQQRRAAQQGGAAGPPETGPEDLRETKPRGGEAS